MLTWRHPLLPPVPLPTLTRLKANPIAEIEIQYRYWDAFQTSQPRHWDGRSRVTLVTHNEGCVR